jgi:hypothetical protein
LVECAIEGGDSIFGRIRARSAMSDHAWLHGLLK